MTNATDAPAAVSDPLPDPIPPPEPLPPDPLPPEPPLPPDPLPDIERGIRSIVRWGNLPRVRERFVAAAGMDLDRASYGVLIRLQECGPTRLSDLAQRLGLDLSTASRQVHHLQLAGLVERVTMEEDRRAALLSVTPSGQAMAERLRAARRAVITDILEGWSQQERRDLGRALTRLAGAMIEFGTRER